MQLDCNTCANHQQGAHPAHVVIRTDEYGTTTCRDCLENNLTYWTPKAGVVIPVKTAAPSKSMQRESDPNGLEAKSPGAKLDFGKAPVVRGCIKYFPRAISAVAMLSKHGAEKYCWNGWEKVEDGINRYDDAIGRHMVGEAIEGEFDGAWKRDFDKDVLHATAVAWNALARLELILRTKEGT